MRKSLTMASVAVLATSLAACSSTGGRKAVEEASNNAGHANTPTMTVALVTHSGPGDTFWDIVRKGAEDAAAKDNVKLEYTSDPDGSKQSNLVQQAVDKKVDGIALTLAKPDAMKGSVEAAKKAGIPVVALNGGLDDWKKMGVESYFGQDEKIAGEAAGDKLKSGGAKKVLCVIHEQGNVGHMDRCAGVKSKFDATENIYVNGTDMPSVQSAITSKLQQDKTIDAVLGLGGPYAMAATKSVKDASSDAKVYTFDTSNEVLGAIKAGTIQWAVDQQPYLQGYLAVDALWLRKNNGNIVGGGQPVLTGPAFIDKSNVADVEKYAKSGRR
ncbi:MULTISPECIES: sugar ABC transporter substrate-binding protein [unclassified Dermacoccus]|uniref:sugar ABC transporter substrate-binding protein n=1 Tax=unclassified Dermacoccus TaxID=2643059 RepID=UPI0001E64307|nr:MULTISPECIES: sugar ABC transporter substrate-binding protein [unclassified Dermacoccus]EFP58583.1 sugar-binding domain protein [Dermacoccus sp. Ellin185]MBO1759030.1 sugar ABC transporter substrate-binding protein [Dermacoccus sp. NHGro5]TCJ90356.1 monosaccharide ABC transporter substrate-binding protein (CUT2 family) [Dermacoccus sp. SAI-028]